MHWASSYFFYMSESYWPSSRGLYCERVKKIRICRQNFARAREDIKQVQKQITVWETQQGAHVEKRLLTLRKNLGAKEQERDFKEKEFQRATSVMLRHRELHSRFYLYGMRPSSVDSLGSRASRNSILKATSGRVVSTSGALYVESHKGSMTPTASTKARDSISSVVSVNSPSLTVVKSVPQGMKPLRIAPKLSTSQSGPGTRGLLNNNN